MVLDERRGSAMLVSTERQGQRLMLLDASEWLVSPFDIPVSRSWESSAVVEFADTGDGSPFPVVMRNRENGTAIRVRLLPQENEIAPATPIYPRVRGSLCARLLKRRIRRMLGVVTGAAATRGRSAPSLRAATVAHRR
jgi:hypothetical protein